LPCVAEPPTLCRHRRITSDSSTGSGPQHRRDGAYAPYPRWDGLRAARAARVIEPTLAALDGAVPYHGLLYCGLLVHRATLRSRYIADSAIPNGRPPLDRGDLLERSMRWRRRRRIILRFACARGGGRCGARIGGIRFVRKEFPSRVSRRRALDRGPSSFAGRTGPSGPLTDGGRVLTVVGGRRSTSCALTGVRGFG
jgi:hypothetical protein